MNSLVISNKCFQWFCAINFDKCFYDDRLSIGDSVTSYEFRAAISAHPEPVNHLNRGELCCWHHRHLEGDVDDKDFCDTGNDLTLSQNMSQLKGAPGSFWE